MKAESNKVFSRVLGIAALTCVSGLALNGLAIDRQTLYWDTARLYPQFRDNLESLNRFGEVAWWFPQYQDGIPGYYLSLLNTSSCMSPVFVLLGALAWLLGKFGILIASFHSWYILYYGFLTPFLFLLAWDAFARRFFSDPLSRVFLLVTAAFSPGVVFNGSDIGFLEPTAYFLFFASAFLDYLQHPARSQFWKLAFSVVTLAVYLNNSYLYWVVLAVPIFLLGIGGSRGLRSLKTWRVALQAVPIRYWLILAVGVLVGVTPAFVTLSQGNEMIRTSLDGRAFYTFDRLMPGNPFELFAASVPGFGFNWKNDGRQYWALLPMSTSYHTAYGYLGAVAVPLLVTGLVWGRRLLRRQTLYWITASFLIICLSAYSPLFTLLLAWDTPLRACNHFSDVTFKAGTYLVVLFGSAVGLTALKRREESRATMVLVFLLSVVGAAFIHLSAKPVEGEFPYLGFFLVLALIMFVSLLGMHARHPKARHRWLQFLVLLSSIDVATNAFLYVRNVDHSTFKVNSGWLANAVINDETAANGIGLRDATHSHYYPNHFLTPRALFEMTRSGISPRLFPKIGCFTSVRGAKPLDEEARAVREGNFDRATLPLDPAQYNSEGFRIFRERGFSSTKFQCRVRLLETSYNRQVFQIEPSEPVVFFVRDGFSPYWKASLNDQDTTVAKAFFHYKAVSVPAAGGRLTLTYRPPYIASLIALAYAVWGCFGVVALVLERQRIEQQGWKWEYSFS